MFYTVLKEKQGRRGCRSSCRSHNKQVTYYLYYVPLLMCFIIIHTSSFLDLSNIF